MKKNLLALLGLTLLASTSFAQNAIVGAGFSTGWGVDNCSVGGGTDFKYMTAVTGNLVDGTGTYVVTTVANGTGNQYMRFGKDWSSTYGQYAITPGSDTQISPNTTYSLNTTCTNSGSQFINVGSTSYNYVFKTINAGVAPTGTFVFFEVQGAVQSVSSVSQSPLAASVPSGQPVTVNATLSGALSTGQAVYLRYTTNAFSTSTVVQMTGAGTAYSATIPANSAATAVQYYVFTSGTANVAGGGSNADLYTINLNNNGGLNYSYTVVQANVTVTNPGNTTPALQTTYITLANAITALNGVTAISGPVTITLTGNETAPAGGYAITAVPTGASATNNITVQGGGSTIQASAALTAGSLTDAIFKLIGADFITIQNFTMQENPANTTTTAASNNMTEFGVALFHSSTTDGAQNNIIQNNTISLNRTYTNTFGVYSNARTSATSITTANDPTSTAGANSSNKVYGNAISNVNYGIVFIGATTSAFMDTGNDIGGSSAPTGNTITNWGGGAAASGYLSLTGNNYCIFVNQQINDNISFNTITSAALTSAVTEGGILKNYSLSQPTGTITTTINNNTVTITQNPNAATTGGIVGVNNQGLTPLLSTATMSMNNNVVQNCVLGGSTSTTNGITAITNLSLPGTMNMTGNTVLNNAITASTATTGINAGIANSGAAGTVNINNNVVRSLASTSSSGQVQAIANTGAVVTALNINSNALGNATSGLFSTSTATSGTLFGIVSSGGAATCALSIQTNDIRGITYNIAASAAQAYIQNSAATLSQNISSNTFTNLNVNTTGGVTFISNSVTAPTAGSKTINNNSIVTAFNKGGAGGTVALYNDGASSVCTTPVQNVGNNFSNITVTGATTISGWFNNDGTGGTPQKTITGNTFSNWTCGSSAVNALQSNFGNTITMSNNTVTNITGTGAITGLLVGSSGTATTLTMATNTITGLSSTGTGGAVTGISNAYPGTANITSNTVNTLSSASTTATVAGITTSGTTPTISLNTINTLSCVGSTSGVTNGIMVTGGTTVNLFKNKIYDLSTTGAFTTTPGVNGMVFSAGMTVSAYNNLIGGLTAPAANSTDAIRGISVTSTTTSSTYNIYYNTVRVPASSTGANFGTTGIFHAASATATTAALNLRNNAIVNVATPNGTGLVVAYRRSVGTAGTLANYASTSNNNDFYAGTPGASNLIYADGTSSAQTMSLYKSGVFTAGTIAPRDANSFTENPPFLSTTGSNANFLHIDPTVATQLESGGAAISGITDDFDGNTRNASTPDVGADEFTGIAIDLNPPAISYATLANTAGTGNRIVTATIGDATAVDAGANLPRIYFKKSTDASYVSTQCSLTGGNAQSGTYSCTIDNSLVGGGGVAAPDIIQYFVVAQDTLSNLGSNPSGATGANVNSITFAGTPNSYMVLPTISGTKTVGLGGDYTTLTAAVADLNSKVITGDVTFTLTDATYPTESFPLTINANSGSGPGPTGTGRVTIKPAPGVSPTITGSSTSCIINFNGADYVIIDGSNTVGGTTRDLTITNSNTGTTSAVICVTSLGAGQGATNNVVKNTNVTGNAATTTFAGIFAGSSTISTATAGLNNDSNTYQNNSISKAQYGIFSQGGSATAKSIGTVITQNLLNTAAPNGLGKTGIYVAFEDGVQITQNSIDGIASAVSSNDVFGISLGLNNVSTSTFTGNEVTNATVSRNYIGTVKHTATYSAIGIGVAPVTTGTGTNLLVNNMVAGVFADATAGDFSAGIFVGGGASTTQVYFNSVSMATPAGAPTDGSDKSFALAIGGSNPIADVRNNILSNTQSVGTGANYAVAFGYSSFTNLTSDYNDLFVSPVDATHFIGGTASISAPTGQATLANLQTATGKDAASKSVDPVFVSATNLHLQVTSTLLGMGVTIPSVTVDFDGDTRQSPPAIGADEVITYTLTYTAGTGGTISGTTPQTVASGGSGTAVTAVPNAGYSFVNWSDNSTQNPRTDTNVTANVSVTANFALNTYQLSVVAGTGGTISVPATSPVTVNHGAATTITAVANAGYTFSGWTVTTGTGSIANAANASTTITLTAGDATVTANFTLNTYQLSVVAGTGGTISAPATSPVTVNHGAATTITAVANAGYTFSGWTVTTGTGSIANAANASTTITLTAGDATVTANFTLNTYQLSVVAGTGGTISVPATSPVTVNHGAATTITAVANAGYTFSGWTVTTGTGSIANAANASTTITLTAGDATVTANFSLNTYQLSVVAGTGGTISVPATSPVTVNHGDATTITAVANAGYTFSGWTVTTGTGSIANAANASTTITLTAGDATVTANFTLNTYQLSVVAGTGGTISVPATSPVTVNHGDATTITAVANAGYTFSGWTVTTGTGSIANAANASTTITLTAGDATVTANFTLNTYQLSVVAGTGGTISAPATSPVTVNHGAATTITAVANAGYTFSGWTVTTGTGSIANAANASTTITLTAGDATVTANFTLNTYQLSVVAGTGGTISVPATSPVTVNHGDATTITAVANAGYTFSGWTVTTGTGSIANAANASTTITLTAGDATVTANFTHPTPVVTNTNDSGANSLRQAVLDSLNGDAITFNLPAGPNTITLTTPITINVNVVINGPANGPLTVSGGGTSRVFNVTTGTTATLSNMTIANGWSAGDSGGIQNDGDLTIENCLLSNNRANGGDGGAMRNDGTMKITNSTLSGNSALVDGGAILNGIGRSLTLGNVTLVKNTAGNNGGGINSAGTLVAGNSILALNNAVSGKNVYVGGGTATSLGYNLTNGSGSGFVLDPTDQVNTDPILGPLQDNGGLTKTHAPLSNSPAIDRGKDIGASGSATGRDQRGATRPVTYGAAITPPTGGDRSDIGAVELGVGVLPTSAVSRKNHTGVGDFDVNLPLSGPFGIECRQGGATNDYQVILNFAAPVNVGSVAVNDGTGSIASSTGNGTNQITLNLTGVTDVQTLTLALFSVNDGVNSGDVGLRMGVLVGDTNGDSTVNSGDTIQTRGRSGQAADAVNFRSDVNTNGTINSGDQIAVRNRAGNFLP